MTTVGDQGEGLAAARQELLQRRAHRDAQGHHAVAQGSASAQPTVVIITGIRLGITLRSSTRSSGTSLTADQVLNNRYVNMTEEEINRRTAAPSPSRSTLLLRHGRTATLSSRWSPLVKRLSRQNQPVGTQGSGHRRAGASQNPDEVVHHPHSSGFERKVKVAGIARVLSIRNLEHRIGW